MAYIGCRILSDLHVLSAVCASSFFDVFFDLLDPASVTLSFAGSDYISDFSADRKSVV